jgi:uncharacterized membrane protein
VEAQLETGKNTADPIVQAIAEAERGTTGEIRVHLSRRWIERNPFKRAIALFNRYGMSRTTHRNAVLIYINRRTRKFAIIGDEGIHKAVGQKGWEALGGELRGHLLTTHYERAIAMTVNDLGALLRLFFPQPD